MSWFTPILAVGSDLPAPPAGSKAATFIFSDIVMIFLAVGAIMLALLIWVIIRGPRQQVRARRIYKHSHSHSHSHSGEEEEEDDSDPASSSTRRRKKRKLRRREHRGRNPTLAETGGLPDPRPPGVPPTI